MKHKIIPYGRHNITPEDIQAVAKTLTSDFLTQGPVVEEFEKRFAEYIGVKYAVAVSNGTAALHLSCIALNVNDSSHVITTPMTFSASANCVRYCNGQVTFADINPDTGLISIESIRKILESSPKGTYQGIIPVDFTGYPLNMEELRKLADQYGLWIIEDACHAPGGYFIDSSGKKQYCGNGIYAELSIFSFHPVKHITTGEGGMITTNDKDLYQKLIMIRTHGVTKQPDLMRKNDGGWYYEMQMLGYNYRMTDINASLGISQLKRAREGVLRRQEIAALYDKAFEGRIQTIKPGPDVNHAYHLYVIKVNNRKELYDRLREKGINSQVHYIPVHTLPYYQDLGYKTGSMPHAEAFYEQCLSIPMYPTLTDEEVRFVIDSVIEFAR
ncbi:MAG: UDP-4-amino-4,6-dideoxy-N-acetyl-beta-L-altrosamine transaminase [Bacteroidales bacterium]|jgi:UDP-4-amino-4,6-dideoxy-N-acetyl-beta-L-altrosamine transaminase|nr:UDP-4-amino-4,6-dideoxy-N-acetyl-beta-L-altrosamine transaminase [Bacteroidales bacterium]